MLQHQLLPYHPEFCLSSPECTEHGFQSSAFSVISIDYYLPSRRGHVALLFSWFSRSFLDLSHLVSQNEVCSAPPIPVILIYIFCLVSGAVFVSSTLNVFPYIFLNIKSIICLQLSYLLPKLISFSSSPIPMQLLVLVHHKQL